MKLPLPRQTLREYLARYHHEHTQLGTRVTHMVGIPMIVASLPAAVVHPPLAGGLFAGGWALQLLGHKLFEKNKPAFLSDPYYLLVGPVWVAAEWMQLLGFALPDVFRSNSDLEASPDATSGAPGEPVAAAAFP
jgi:uncharacterized membrane protein YGL010W